MKKIKIGIVGGDRRMLEVAECLKEYDVKIWGIDPCYIKSGIHSKNIDEVLVDADVLILPSPPCADDIRVNCPLYTEESGEKIHRIFETLKKDAIVLGGRISPRIKDLATRAGLKVFDYFASEEVLIKNAVPTAEGAIGVAIYNTDVTVFDSKIAIIGYGRIGRALALRLTALGADVTVFDRKDEKLALAMSEGARGVRIEYKDGKSSLLGLSEGFDIIYNTVPLWLVTEEIVSKIPNKTLVVDLASAPGGIDITVVKKYGTNHIQALAIPEKIAPRSAGRIIAESIIKIIGEELV